MSVRIVSCGNYGKYVYMKIMHNVCEYTILNTQLLLATNFSQCCVKNNEKIVKKILTSVKIAVEWRGLTGKKSAE